MGLEEFTLQRLQSGFELLSRDFALFAVVELAMLPFKSFELLESDSFAI